MVSCLSALGSQLEKADLASFYLVTLRHLLSDCNVPFVVAEMNPVRIRVPILLCTNLLCMAPCRQL